MPSTLKLKPWNAILLIAALLILSSVPARAGEPFLDVVINVPQMLLAAEKSMSNGEDGVLSALKQCGVSTAHIFLYPDEEFEIVPVVVLDGTTRAALTHLLDGAGLLAPYVEKISVGIYRLKEAPTEPESEDDIDGKSQLSAGRFRIWLLKEGAIIAPVSIVKSWKQGATRPMATSVSGISTWPPSDPSGLISTNRALDADSVAESCTGAGASLPGMGVPHAPQKANPALTTAPHAGQVEPSPDGAETAGSGSGAGAGSSSGSGGAGSDAVPNSVAAEPASELIA
jgi:hypothetical protein